MWRTDGGTQSSNFFPFDGDFATLRRELPQRLVTQFWQRGVLASHYLRRDHGSRVLIIGSAGGQETKAAVMYGASKVDAVEMVGTVVELATHEYAAYIGHVFQQPGVHLMVGEGRSFLRASHETYDIIEIFSNYTSSSIAEGSGAIGPVYLQTTEAYHEYLSHLAPNGILHVSRYAYPRMIATAAAAWHSMGRDQFRSHVAVFEKVDAANDHNPTILIKMSPWTVAEIADLTAFFSFRAEEEPPYQFAENPLDPAHSFLPDAFYAGALPPTLVAEAPYEVSAVTDDDPYFNFLRRSVHQAEPDRVHGLDATTAAILNAQLVHRSVPMDWLHLMVTAVAAILYGVVFVVIPLRFSRVGRQTWSGKGAVYPLLLAPRIRVHGRRAVVHTDFHEVDRVSDLHRGDGDYGNADCRRAWQHVLAGGGRTRNDVLVSSICRPPRERRRGVALLPCAVGALHGRGAGSPHRRSRSDDLSGRLLYGHAVSFGHHGIADQTARVHCVGVEHEWPFYDDRECLHRAAVVVSRISRHAADGVECVHGRDGRVGALRRSNRQRVHSRDISCGRLASRATLRPPHGVAS